MAIWMDMTNSLHAWQGGVVGIVRAELEIAKNMKAENPDVHFCKFDGVRFVEVKEEELAWLWNEESLGDGYLRAMGRTQKAGLDEQAETGVSVEQLRSAYPGLNNAYMYSGSRLRRVLWGLELYAHSLPSMISMLLKGMIRLVGAPLKVVSTLRWGMLCKRMERENAAAVEKPNTQTDFSCPFSDEDTIFSCGWIYSGKEAEFERIKQKLPNLFLVYLIYDIILIRENTKQYYSEQLSKDFESYVNWVSMHCDAVFYGGKTAMEDTQAYQKEHYLPIPPGFPVYFGSDIIRSPKEDDEKGREFANKTGIKGDFILAVGSMDGRKNYSTLYRAMTILADREPEACPQLVIVGKGDACKELLDTMQRDPRTKDQIILVAPTDEELHWLYKNAKFVVLASTWEGWSLTLPEALQYNKLIIAADVKPLRETGEPYAIFADTFDPFEWADKISYYLSHPEEVRTMETRLRNEYKCITWKDCGIQIAHLLSGLNAEKKISADATLYMDITLTLSTALWGGNITGILRSELMLAKFLYRKYPTMKFFAINDTWGYIPIDVSIIAEILTGENLDADFKQCRGRFAGVISVTSSTPATVQENESLRYKQDAYWFITSAFPAEKQEKMIAYGKKKKQKMIQNHDNVSERIVPAVDVKSGEIYKVPFRKGDVVFTAGTGSGEDTHKKLLATKAQIGYKYCPIVYDYTPILLPQVHQLATIEHYIPFLDFTSKMSDFIFYGGETARHDGIVYQKENLLPIPPSCAVKFGSNIKSEDEEVEDIEDQEKKEKDVLKRLGIKGAYIMAVGTMEVRKNHETLYRAYLRMMDQYEDIPQMVFCGHPGWKAKEFLETMNRDERVKGKIIQLSPTDEELDILYKNCEFTVLASLYEGWSLTLPESYWYNKFCLCCDTPALKETAGDLAEYIHCWDEKKWAERIHYYHTHSTELEKREQRIAREWHSISWDECADGILAKLKEQLGNSQ